MSTRFRIALAQVNVTVGDLDGNREKIIAFARRAEKMGADLVAFPELALSGYPPEDLLLKKRFNLDVARSLHKLARENIRPIMVLGYPHLDKKETNSAAVIYRGKILASVD